MNLELQEKRMVTQRLLNEANEAAKHKNSMKNRMEEYEDKIKKLIKEFADESMKHIKETNEIHSNYRGYKTRAEELE